MLLVCSTESSSSLRCGENARCDADLARHASARNGEVEGERDIYVPQVSSDTFKNSL